MRRFIRYRKGIPAGAVASDVSHTQSGAGGPCLGVRELVWSEDVLSEGLSGAEVLESSYRSQICAAIVTYNIAEAIRRCFDSIRGQVGHVIIVDNGSDELTLRE